MKNARKGTGTSLLLILFLLLQDYAFSQDTKTMDLIFKVRNHDVSGKTPIPGVSVSVYEKASNKLLQTRYTPEDGNIKFTLELYKDYFFTFTRKDFVTKKFVLDASVPGKESKSKLYYYVEHIVNMYGITSANLGAELLDKPFDRLVYSASENNFSSDPDYQKSLKKELAKLTPAEREALLNKLKGGGGGDDADKEKKYKEAVATGDRALGTKDYLTAKDAYYIASTLKPNDKYSRDKLKQIDVILKSRNPADIKYAELIAQADKDFNTKQYEQAKKGYQEASKLKPGEKYPKQKIDELAQLAFKEGSKKYKDAIYKADKFFLEKNYVKAKEAYTEATGLSPFEKYPKDKLAEISKMYKDAVFTADKLFLNKELDRAKEAYNTALALNPSEQYPKDQIKEIIRQLRADEATADYPTLVSNGDKAFKEKNYMKAKELFANALKQKPTEKYPKDQLAKIDAAIAKDPNFKKELDKKYNEAMKKGKEALDNKDYETSRDAYSEASTLKPEQKMPKAQLAKVEELLKAVMKELDNKYNSALALAEKELGLKHYDKAKTSFNEALKLKPNEKLPKDKLAEVDKLILAEKSDSGQNYKNAISKGDKAFNEKDYTTAKEAYAEAEAINPGQKYPKDRMVEIDKLIKEMENNLAAIDNLMDPKTRAAAGNNQVTQQLMAMREEQLAKMNQMKMLKKAYAKHMANLSTKYSTQNPLTKLLDIVDTKAIVNDKEPLN